ncbi:MAG: hypothetical protein V1779_04455 [bacterium]
MKNIIILTALVVFSFLIISSCGEPKKDAPEDTKQEQLQQEQKNIEAPAAGQTEDKIEEGDTQLGEAPEAVEPEKKDYSKEALRCQIVLLDDVATGNFRKLTKPQALEFVEKGKILVVRAENGAIFFVYNEDGSFASKNLARYAANNYIGIIGKPKYIYGLNIIIAQIIESSD